MLFRGRHFRDDIIVLCVRWYLRYSLSYRDLGSPSGLKVNHSTEARWVLWYALELSKRIRRHLRRPGGSREVDEALTILGRWNAKL
jgi:transposase-like protein